MISFDVDGGRFQVRAAAVFLHEGHVLLHRALTDDFWALPGGKVEGHEDAASTVRREMVEELGEPIECGRLLYVVENFFCLRGVPNHELGMYFAASLQPHSRLLDKAGIFRGCEANVPLEFRWFDQDALTRMDIRPAFLRRSLALPILEFEHVVDRDEGSIEAIEAEWDQLADEREAELESGAVKPVPLDEAMARLHAGIGAK